MTTPDPEPFTLNLNQMARVRLTARGEEILRQWGEETGISIHANLPEDCPLETPLWNLMQIFGPTMDYGLHGRPFVDGKIEVTSEMCPVTMEEITALAEAKTTHDHA